MWAEESGRLSCRKIVIAYRHAHRVPLRESRAESGPINRRSADFSPGGNFYNGATGRRASTGAPPQGRYCCADKEMAEILQVIAFVRNCFGTVAGWSKAFYRKESLWRYIIA